MNLIGEHIDYEGYSVLPMAIRQDTIVAIGPRDDEETPPRLCIANVESDIFSSVSFLADPTQVSYTTFFSGPHMQLVWPHNICHI